MKIPLQTKIAELECRIQQLERSSPDQRNYKYFSVDQTGLQCRDIFGEHWDKMWDEFRLVMKSAFGR